MKKCFVALRDDSLNWTRMKLHGRTGMQVNLALGQACWGYVFNTKSLIKKVREKDVQY